MAKRQAAFPGMEREKTDGEVAAEEAHEKWLDAKAERKAMKVRETQLHVELIAIMNAHKMRKYKYRGEDGIAREFSLDSETKVRSRKLPEEQQDADKAPPAPNGENGVHPGLIDQALASQADEANVEVTADGDVTVPDTAAPKRGRKPKAQA
jgi:hypothetical protein